MREDEGVLVDQDRKEDPRILCQSEGKKGRIEHLLVVLAKELDPAGITEHETVSMIHPDVPGRAQSAVCRHHDNGEAIERSAEHVFAHVSQPIGGAGCKGPGSPQGEPHANRHRTVLRLDPDDLSLGEIMRTEKFDALCLRSDGINSPSKSPGLPVGFTCQDRCRRGGMVRAQEFYAHCVISIASRGHSSTQIPQPLQ